MRLNTAIITGSGGLPLADRLPIREVELDTPYGAVPGPVRARASQQLSSRALRPPQRDVEEREAKEIAGPDDAELIALPRHGEPRTLAPHAVNYRANLWLLKQLGARRIVAVYTVGAIDAALQPGDLILPRQIIDYTWGRPHTFDETGGLHVDITEPFDAEMVGSAAAEAKRLGMRIVADGVYGCTQGPRLETAAEITRLERDGCTLVGMTAMPEAGLARELDLPLLGVCIAVNPAAGRGPDPTRIDHDALARDRLAGIEKANRLIAALCGFERG